MTATIGFVVGHLPTYYAVEHDVPDRAMRTLRALVADRGITVAGSAEPVVDAEQARAVVLSLAEAGAVAVVVLHAAFTMGDVTEAVAEAGLPVVVWTVDEPTLDGPVLLNSFVSGLMGASILRAAGHQDRTNWWHGVDDVGIAADEVLGATAVLGAIRSTRVGFLGGVAPSFSNFAVDAVALRDRFGVEVHADGLDPLLALVDEHGAATTTELGALRERLDRDEVTEERDMRRTAAIAVALRRFAAIHRCSTMAVSDWSEFQDRLDVHPGLAFSWVDDSDAVPVACEGDVMGAVSMVALRAVAARVDHRPGACLLDVVSLSPDRSALQLWHCGGSPFDLADTRGVGAIDHSTLGRKIPGSRLVGAVADLTFRWGPVTVLRFGNDLRRAFLAEARIVAGPGAGFDGTRGWAADWRVGDETMTAMDVADLLVSNGVEHHVALVAGHHAAPLRRALAWLGVDEIAL